MRRSAGERFEMVYAALSAAPATAQQLSDKLGLTYSNVYYVLRTMKDLNHIHIKQWVHVGSVQKPAAVYAVGKSSQSVSMMPSEMSNLTLDAAIYSWIKGVNDDQI